MARARNIKPGFFKNYDLADLGPHAQLLFAGLWCLADREGRLEDKPRLIKAEIFPYYDCDVNGELTNLERLGFVKRYQAQGFSIIRIENFVKHQSPHHTEKASMLPAEETASPANPHGNAPPDDNGNATMNSRKLNGGNPPDSLIHRFSDSPIPDSGFTDSPNSDFLQQQPRSAVPSATPPTKDQRIDDERRAACRAAWDAYAQAYLHRYGTEPVRNAKVNKQIVEFVARLGYGEAAYVAEFFVWHNNAYYVREMHTVGAMLKDAEKLRTEWATNSRMTQTKALQVDKAQTNLDAFAPLIAAAKAKEEAERSAENAV